MAQFVLFGNRGWNMDHLQSWVDRPNDTDAPKLPPRLTLFFEPGGEIVELQGDDRAVMHNWLIEHARTLWAK